MVARLKNTSWRLLIIITRGRELFSSTFLPIKTDNNLDAYYYSEETYEEAKKVESAAVAVSATSLTSGFFCMVLKSSLPLVMMMSSLQLVFFSLATIDGMHPAA